MISSLLFFFSFFSFLFVIEHFSLCSVGSYSIAIMNIDLEQLIFFLLLNIPHRAWLVLIVYYNEP